jgi:hypothetical protein
LPGAANVMVAATTPAVATAVARKRLRPAIALSL